MNRFKPLFFAMGAAFLVYAIQSSGGIGSLVSALGKMGWWFPLAFVPTVIAHWLRTVAWSVVFEEAHGRPAMKILWRIRLIGEALNYLTFAGPFLGDPAKASLLKSETGCRNSVVIVATDRFLYALASTLFIVVSASLWLGIQGIWAIVMFIAVIGLGPIVLRYCGKNISAKTTMAVIGLHMLSNLCMALEAAILLRGLGVDATILQAASIEAMNKGLNGVFFFLPMQIGVAEGSSAMLSQAMNMGAAAGLALGLARRVRSLMWSITGLLLMLKPGSALLNRSLFTARS